jgi:hypothetical protein
MTVVFITLMATEASNTSGLTAAKSSERFPWTNGVGGEKANWD